MRKPLVWVLGLAVALALGVTGMALATNTQTMNVTVSPSKVPKTKFVAGKLRSTTVTGCQSPCSGNGAIKPVTKAQIFYDKNIKFDVKGIPTCRDSQLQSTTTAQAKQVCGRALVGSGQAKVQLAGDPNPNNEIPAVITAFNGAPKGGKPVILLHTRVDAIGSTQVLVGTLNVVHGKYAWRLDVVVPPLPLDTAATLFDVTVKHTPTHVGGKRHIYITEKCGDANKTWDYKGTFTYSGGQPPITVSDTQRCRVL
jgi:hypothetical protein